MRSVMSMAEDVKREKRMRVIDMLDYATQELYRAYQLAKLHGGTLTKAMRDAKAEYSRASRAVNPALAHRTRIANRRWYHNRKATDAAFMPMRRLKGREADKRRRGRKRAAELVRGSAP